MAAEDTGSMGGGAHDRCQAIAVFPVAVRSIKPFSLSLTLSPYTASAYDVHSIRLLYACHQQNVPRPLARRVAVNAMEPPLHRAAFGVAMLLAVLPHVPGGDNYATATIASSVQPITGEAYHTYPPSFDPT